MKTEVTVNPIEVPVLAWWQRAVVRVVVFLCHFYPISDHYPMIGYGKCSLLEIPHDRRVLVSSNAIHGEGR
jgi:hypothetical protein